GLVTSFKTDQNIRLTQHQESISALMEILQLLSESIADYTETNQQNLHLLKDEIEKLSQGSAQIALSENEFDVDVDQWRRQILRSKRTMKNSHSHAHVPQTPQSAVSAHRRYAQQLQAQPQLHPQLQPQLQPQQLQYTHTQPQQQS